jgi:RNA polymerase sigma-70 factor (family 1)
MAKLLPDLSHIVSDIAFNNSETSYKQLFGILFPAINRFAFCLVKSKELSEEVASDVMISLWKNREKLPDIENIKVYALVIAKNLSLNILKKQSKQATISIDDVDIEVVLENHNPEQVLINGELKKSLEQAIQTLPPKCKLVFKLVKEEGFSYSETADILNISVKTVDAHLVTAVRKLTATLRAEFNLA